MLLATRGSSNNVTDQASCDIAAQIIFDAARCDQNNVCYTGSVFPGQAITSIKSFFINGECNIIVDNASCSTISDNLENIAPCYIDINQLLANGGNPGDCHDVRIASLPAVDGTLTIPVTPAQTNGITFTCGADNAINYNYINFDVSYQSSIDQSYLTFTPKTTVNPNSPLILGNGVNNDGSENFPLNVTDLNTQGLNFFLNPICGTDHLGRDIMKTSLDDVSSCCHLLTSNYFHPGSHTIGTFGPNSLHI